MPGRHFVLLCLLIPALPVTAEMYTWTDDRGVTHFSDKAPAKGKPKPINLGTTSVVSMEDGIRQSEKVSAIRRQVEQALERDIPRRSSGNQADSAAEKQCNKLEQRLAIIQKRLRAGYSNDRGNSLRRQRRTLSQRHSRECVLG
jgi:hypothetical protein